MIYTFLFRWPFHRGRGGTKNDVDGGKLINYREKFTQFVREIVDFVGSETVKKL